ncbi:hypothetical protein HYALB_00012571 [Hymenoscyphus albidus]|uniref:Uncharacterized protein n=1 Tax=Hymenoscyphus albidus TaxID=595503 RepID=A0A9N9Q650_9HELO|nr:hypothetical protein HYALB_00012571 [Hymenoscyphus albidus]
MAWTSSGYHRPQEALSLQGLPVVGLDISRLSEAKCKTCLGTALERKVNSSGEGRAGCSDLLVEKSLTILLQNFQLEKQ